MQSHERYIRRTQGPQARFATGFPQQSPAVQCRVSNLAQVILELRRGQRFCLRCPVRRIIRNPCEWSGTSVDGGYKGREPNAHVSPVSKVSGAMALICGLIANGKVSHSIHSKIFGGYLMRLA